jgi:hypothetical protein
VPLEASFGDSDDPITAWVTAYQRNRPVYCYIGNQLQQYIYILDDPGTKFKFTLPSGKLGRGLGLDPTIALVSFGYLGLPNHFT